MRIRPDKKGTRALGIAESFRLGANTSTLAGIVIRRDSIVDGIIFGDSTIGGDDATESIVGMYHSLARQDINCIMIDGLIISMYNIIDGQVVADDTGLPVI